MLPEEIVTNAVDPEASADEMKKRFAAEPAKPEPAKPEPKAKAKAKAKAKTKTKAKTKVKAKADEPKPEPEPEPKPESRAVLANRETRIQRGEEALDRLTSDLTWTDWLAIGQGFDEGRTEAFAKAKTNKAEGKGYILAFSEWLEKHPKYRAVDGSDRKRLFDVLDNLSAIEDWRKKLFIRRPDLKYRLNHPSTVWRRWKADNEKPEEEEKAAKAEAKQKLKQEQEGDFADMSRSELICALKNANEAHGYDLGGVNLAFDDPLDLARTFVQQNAKQARNLANAILDEPEGKQKEVEEERDANGNGKPLSISQHFDKLADVLIDKPERMRAVFVIDLITRLGVSAVIWGKKSNIDYAQILLKRLKIKKRK
jgi:antitoxin component HigA of HigAB toxin-antitoxin module